jgi:signal transduction histidine kinase
MICMSMGYTYAQDPKSDSLKQLLVTLPADTHRVNVLNALVTRIYGAEFEASLRYLNESMALADSLDYLEGLAEAKIRNAELQNTLGASASSMQSSTEAYRLFVQLRDSAGMGRTLMSIGLVQNSLRQNAKAIETMHKAIDCYKAAHDIRGQISAQHNLAVILVANADTVAGKAQYLENLRLLEGTEYWHIYAGTYNNLGNIFKPVTQGDSAIHYYEIALKYKYMSKVLNKGSIGNTLMNIGNVHLMRGDYEAALARLEEATTLVEASHEKPRLMQLHQLKGQLFYKMGRFQKSAEEFEQQAIVQDSLFTPQMTEQASRLEAAFNSENQKKEIELLSKSKALDDIEKTRWRWITIGVGIGLVLSLALLIVVVLRSRERARMWKLLEQKGDEIKRQQQEIVLQNEALSLQNKRLADLNHEKDALIGIVAHDIRAPLNRSAAIAALIESHGNLSPEQERLVKMIQKVSDDGGRLIQDLLELNSYEQNAHRVDLADVDLKLVLEHAMHGFAADAALKGITLHLEAASTIAKTDEKLLGRILDNLVSNAVKFTPKNKHVYLGIVTEVDRHWVTVRDEGPGITVADQAKMFQKFQRLSARPTGGESSTGLGLSIVRALADRISAELTFTSEVGVGTAFKIGIHQ